MRHHTGKKIDRSMLSCPSIKVKGRVVKDGGLWGWWCEIIQEVDKTKKKKGEATKSQHHFNQ